VLQRSSKENVNILLGKQFYARKKIYENKNEYDFIVRKWYKK